MYLYQVMITLHFFIDVLMMLNQDKNRKLRHIARSEKMGKLINRTPGSRLLISSLPGSALRLVVESHNKPPYVNKRSQSLTWKRHSPSILYIIGMQQDST